MFDTNWWSQKCSCHESRCPIRSSIPLIERLIASAVTMILLFVTHAAMAQVEPAEDAPRERFGFIWVGGLGVLLIAADFSQVERYIELADYGTVPEISKREINTAVLVEDGQTVVIGGVYEFTDRASVAKVPFLGDIPFLGNLFKKKGRLKDKAELLIFITPKVLSVAKR